MSLPGVVPMQFGQPQAVLTRHVTTKARYTARNPSLQVCLPGRNHSTFFGRVGQVRGSFRTGFEKRQYRKFCPKASESEDPDDLPPELTGDWRDFRARLVMSQYSTADPQSLRKGVTDPPQADSEDAEASERVPLPKGKDPLGKRRISMQDIQAKQDQINREMIARMEAASAANQELLRKQKPKLAANPPWAHAIPAPEKGCLLVAREERFTGTNQQYFHQAVILLVEHGEEGSMGLILNRPLIHKFKQIAENPGPLGDNPVYFGGDVGRSVSCIHGVEGLEGAVEIRPGVFYGGMKDALEKSTAGEEDPEDFKFFCGYAGWSPGQLEEECRRGVWYSASCAKELMLKPVIQLPKPLWREVLELMGGPYTEAAKKGMW